tara:strand:+ start:97 stop:267 length:171 start_codon:yes stop_codon:yes gene_type:complete
MTQASNNSKAKVAGFAFGNGKFTKSVLVGTREVRRKLARRAKKESKQLRRSNEKTI